MASTIRSGGALLALALASASPALAQDEDAALAELLAEIDDPGTAIASARRQVAEGDLTGAAATLEGALLNDPNAHDARLYYASVLCRLGDRRAATIEVAKLDRQQFSDPAWQETAAACGPAVSRPLPPEEGLRTGWSGEAYAGLAYDSDAAGAIVFQSDFFGNVDDDDGLALISGAYLSYRAPSYAGAGGFYGSARLTMKHDIAGPDLDYDIGEIAIGFGSGGGALGWAVGPVFRHVRLFNDPYVTEYGGQAEVTFLNDRPGRIRVALEGVHQDYDNDALPGNAGDGFWGIASLSYDVTLSSKSFLSIGLGGELKDADVRSLGYRGGRLFGLLYVPFDNRHYLTLDAMLRHIDFRGSGPGDRDETRGYARLGYGVPLSGDDLFIEGAASYTFRKVDLEGLPDFDDYGSLGTELRLVVRF